MQEKITLIGNSSNDLPEDIESGDEQEAISGEQLATYISEIADTVRVGLDQSIAILTPWFFNNMPRIYYATTPRAEKLRHLSAIITGHVFETKQTVELWDRNRLKVTYIGPGSDQKILIEMAEKIKSTPIKMGALYFSRDKLLFLSTFFCASYVQNDENNERIKEKISRAQLKLEKTYPEEKEAIRHFLSHLDNDFVIYATVTRLEVTYRMLREMIDHEGTQTIIEPFEDASSVRLSLGIKNLDPSEVLVQILNLMHRYEFNISRAFVIQLTKNYAKPVSIFHFIIKDQSGKNVDANGLNLARLNKALKTLSWIDNDEYTLLTGAPHYFSINGVNLFRSMATWIHVLLGKENPYYYSDYKIRTTFFEEIELTKLILDLFRMKFDPLRDSDRKEKLYPTARSNILEKIELLTDEVQKKLFRESVKFVDNILKTNYYSTTKTGLAFRLDPQILDETYYPQKPFGIFFIVGRNYRFFHVRWKDIARGGLRAVIPRSQSDHQYALAGIFDEVYGLSHAQQLKNKDIPEGGSKGVILITPGASKDQAIRGSINALLDLLVPDDEYHNKTEINRLSYYHKDEIIYLGPDENIDNELIAWIPEQARRRGYPYASAFMSSKPEDGINHKEFGVTSEGVSVYIFNMLQHLGIDPYKEKFSVKITGGPDGDVAGNLLKILYREYSTNARIVAVSDGFGAACDPEGLAWDELLRLFHEGKSIVHFDHSYLSSKEAYVLPADTAEHIKIRNEIFMTTYADIFVPAGGRPYTVSEKNWHKFLNEEGKPTMKGVVEGANIFFTAAARDKIQKSGVLMLKDSSANKTGVICSSFEIIASLILKKSEFIALKKTYVEQVISILRDKADKEARLLFTEYLHHDGEKTLVGLSMEISREINEVTDLLLDRLTEKGCGELGQDIFDEIIYQHCPPILVEKYKARILTLLPKAHQIAIVAASIASNIVYSEGLGWIHQIAESDRFNAIITYVRQRQKALELIDAVQKSNLIDKNLVKAILEMSAARNLTVMSLESSKQARK
ncbi:MAG: NAD-glutamate dehydrogenase [Oligoflexales bacterium]|nr:NAD-glutamate dehydrogenase [Oligoflexales bacterium]